jgi:hypothetical protein
MRGVSISFQTYVFVPWYSIWHRDNTHDENRICKEELVVYSVELFGYSPGDIEKHKELLMDVNLVPTECLSDTLLLWCVS